MPKFYYPRGQMCLVCVNLMSRCDHLPFHSYPKSKNPLDKGTDDQEVICRHFKKPDGD